MSAETRGLRTSSVDEVEDRSQRKIVHDILASRVIQVMEIGGVSEWNDVTSYDNQTLSYKK